MARPYYVQTEDPPSAAELAEESRLSEEWRKGYHAGFAAALNETPEHRLARLEAATGYQFDIDDKDAF